MGENIKNGRRYLILGQIQILSPILNILPHYEKPRVRCKKTNNLLSIYCEYHKKSLWANFSKTVKKIRMQPGCQKPGHKTMSKTKLKHQLGRRKMLLKNLCAT